jgi:hypothetical protein
MRITSIKSLLLSAAVLLGVNTAHAIPAVDYSGFVGMEITANGTFQTTDAVALSSFLNWADFLPVADGFGKIRISGVQLTGTANDVYSDGSLLAQKTIGGIVEALDAANNVLLSATFTAGTISFAQNGTGSQFSVGLATFGGLLAQYFVPNSATHSISLINWNPVAINQITQQIGKSSGFGNGLIAGNTANVPEPTTMLLLGSGIVGAVVRRRKTA